MAKSNNRTGAGWTRKWPATVIAAAIIGTSGFVSAIVSGGFGLFSRREPGAGGNPIINQGPGSPITISDSDVHHSNIGIIAESEEAKNERLATLLDRDNKKYLVSASKWVEGSVASPSGRQRIIRRPVISAEPSATRPTVRLDTKSSRYIIGVTQYVRNDKAEGGRKLEHRTVESDSSFGEPTIEGPFN